MNLGDAVDAFGESAVLAAGAAAIGVLFGFFAQRSRFCLRAAVIEFWRRHPGEKLAVWLLAFATALVAVQALILLRALDLSGARQLATRGSLSGALIGGVLFGAGMIMTRGCASRLIVLSANGNLRALLSGLVFAVTAQASLGGVLAPLREAISLWWTVEGGASRELLTIAHLGPWGGLALGLVWLSAALWFAVRSGRNFWKWAGGIGCGFMIGLGWWFTFTVAATSFQLVPIQGLTFSGPSAEWLMRMLRSPAPLIGFDTGFLPGVFAGAFLGGLLGRELKLEGFRDGYAMRRYIVGAVLMGFGSMLAGGCAVGAGLSGGSAFALTAWLTLLGMWGGAGLTDWLLDRPREGSVKRTGMAAQPGNLVAP